MRYPSVKTLSQLCDGDAEKAKELRGILDGSIDLTGYRCDQTSARNCYNPLPLALRKLHCCNEALGTEYGCYGVEFADCAGDQDRMINRERVRGFDYINTGDFHHVTLVLTNTGRFRVCCPADIIERRR